MKYALIFLVVFLSACSGERTEVRSHSIVLIKIEAIYRAGKPDGYMLTWVTDEKDTCVEFVPEGKYYVGMTDKAKLRR
jgi:hypothetical protein